MALLRPSVWTQQPQQACEIDWSNPITRGLVVAISGANPRLNSALNKPASFVGTPGSALTIDGRSTEFTRSSTQGISVGTSAAFNPAAITLLSIYTPKSLATGSAHMLFSRDDNSLGRAFSLDLHWNSGYGVRYYVAGGGSVGTNELRQGASAVVGKRYVVVARQTGSAAALFVDGALVSSSAAFTAKPLATGDTRIGIRTYSGSNEAADGFIPLSLMWSRALSDSEIRSISANPWQIFNPIQRRIFAEVSAGGGGVTITANIGQATASGLTATLTQASTLIATQGTATASGLSATLAQAFTLSANRGTATASGAHATIAQAATISANLGTATASGFAADVQSAGNVTISANIGIATASGRQANIGDSVTVSASRGTATAAGYTAAIEIAFTLAANRGTAQATGKTATIYASDVISASMGQGIASGYAALIVAGEIYARAPSGSGPMLITQNQFRPAQTNTSRYSNTGGSRR